MTRRADPGAGSVSLGCAGCQRLPLEILTPGDVPRPPGNFLLPRAAAGEALAREGARPQPLRVQCSSLALDGARPGLGWHGGRLSVLDASRVHNRQEDGQLLGQSGWGRTLPRQPSPDCHPARTCLDKRRGGEEWVPGETTSKVIKGAQPIPDSSLGLRSLPPAQPHPNPEGAACQSLTADQRAPPPGSHP